MLPPRELIVVILPKIVAPRADAHWTPRLTRIFHALPLYVRIDANLNGCVAKWHVTARLDRLTDAIEGDGAQLPLPRLGLRAFLVSTRGPCTV